MHSVSYQPPSERVLANISLDAANVYPKLMDADASTCEFITGGKFTNIACFSQTTEQPTTFGYTWREHNNAKMWTQLGSWVEDCLGRSCWSVMSDKNRMEHYTYVTSDAFVPVGWSVTLSTCSSSFHHGWWNRLYSVLLNIKTWNKLRLKL